MLLNQIQRVNPLRHSLKGGRAAGQGPSETPRPAGRGGDLPPSLASRARAGISLRCRPHSHLRHRAGDNARPQAQRPVWAGRRPPGPKGEPGPRTTVAVSSATAGSPSPPTFKARSWARCRPLPLSPAASAEPPTSSRWRCPSHDGGCLAGRSRAAGRVGNPDASAERAHVTGNQRCCGIRPAVAPLRSTPRPRPRPRTQAPPPGVQVPAAARRRAGGAAPGPALNGSRGGAWPRRPAGPFPRSVGP